MRYSQTALQKWLQPLPSDDGFDDALAAFRRAVAAERSLDVTAVPQPGQSGHDPAAWNELTAAMDETTRAAKALRERIHAASH